MGNSAGPYEIPKSADIVLSAIGSMALWLVMLGLDPFGVESGTELAALLEQSSDYTLFIPTNAALSEYFGGDAKVALLPENREKLGELVKAHIIKGRLGENHDVVKNQANKLRIGELENAGGSVIGHPVEAVDASILVIDSVLPFFPIEN